MNETKLSSRVSDKVIQMALDAMSEYQSWRSVSNEAELFGVANLQYRLMVWERENFGTQRAMISAAGAVEEIGELLDAIEYGTKEEVVDAVGDIMVYLCQLCSKSRLDFASIIDSTESDSYLDLDGMYTMMHVVLKREQGIRGYDDRDTYDRDIAICVYRIMGHIKHLTSEYSLEYKTVFFNVATEVMRRNWRENKRDGSADECKKSEVDKCLERSSGDAVNPDHYKGEIECIDAMQQQSTPEEFAGFCRLTAFKYLWRFGKKDGEPNDRDAKKAQWYLDRLTKALGE